MYSLKALFDGDAWIEAGVEDAAAEGEVDDADVVLGLELDGAVDGADDNI